MSSVFIHLSNTFFNKLILIDLPVDKDNSSTSLEI